MIIERVIITAIITSATTVPKSSIVNENIEFWPPAEKKNNNKSWFWFGHFFVNCNSVNYRTLKCSALLSFGWVNLSTIYYFTQFQHPASIVEAQASKYYRTQKQDRLVTSCLYTVSIVQALPLAEETEDKSPNTLTQSYTAICPHHICSLPYYLQLTKFNVGASVGNADIQRFLWTNTKTAFKLSAPIVSSARHVGELVGDDVSWWFFTPAASRTVLVAWDALHSWVKG